MKWSSALARVNFALNEKSLAEKQEELIENKHINFEKSFSSALKKKKKMKEGKKVDNKQKNVTTN